MKGLNGHTLRVIFAGGGTAGHINPAISIANYIRKKDPDVKILYIGNMGSMEESLVKRENINFKGINISGFSRKLNLKGLKSNILTVKRLVLSVLESKRILKQFRPDFCIGTGGYVSGPVLWQASNMGIPIFIHEQNAFPGVTTKILAKRSKCIFLGMQDAKKYLNKNAKTKFTGNPVREDVITCVKSTSRKVLNLDGKKLTILSFGGSLGAERINRAILELILEFNKNKEEIQHIHAYGKYGKWFIPELKKRGIDPKECKNLYIKEYLDNMPLCLSSADLVICRAGAISLSELAVQGKPSVLIPSPNVTANHQYHNAMALVKRNAAIMVQEKDLSGKTLTNIVKKLLSKKELLKTYSSNISKLAIIDVCEKIFNEIEKVVIKSDRYKWKTVLKT